MAEGQGAAGLDVEKDEGQKNKDEKKFPNYLIAMQMTNPQVCPVIFSSPGRSLGRAIVLPRLVSALAAAPLAKC